MISIFRGASAPGAELCLDNMFRDRKRVFVDMLKWSLAVTDGQFEIDQFDTERAVYLIAAREDGSHLGSIRLLPTDGPHLLGTVFPYLCEGPVPVGADIWEISRGCLSPRMRAAERLHIRNMLTTAAAEFALIEGIARYTCIADSGWLSQILSLGWDCCPLGIPRRLGGPMTGALSISIGEDTIAKLQAAGSYAPAELVLADMPSVLAA